MHVTRLAPAAVLALVAVPLGAATAHADPNGDVFDLVCDNGRTYPIVTSGSGEFTPAHDTSSTTILVPTSFHGFSFVVTDADGNVVEEETDDSEVVKGSSQKQRATTTTCTYSFTETFEDPELGLLTVTGSGGVTGFTTPAR